MRPLGRPRGSIDRHGKALPVQSAGYANDKAALCIGEAIRATREAMDISAEELANRIELNLFTVLAWERGAKTPSIRNLVRCAWALGVKPSALMEGV